MTGWRPSAGRVDVLYDGGCGLCVRTMRVLRALDWFGRLHVVDINEQWEQLERLYRGVSRDACVDQMHVVAADGSVTAGFDGFRTLAWRVPLLAVAAPLLYVPGVPWCGRRVYRYVATRRSTTCRTLRA